MDTAHFTTQPILSIPAQNTLGFLECVFTCLDEGRLFAITRDPQAVDGLGMVVETATLEPARGGWGTFPIARALRTNPHKSFSVRERKASLRRSFSAIATWPRWWGG